MEHRSRLAGVGRRCRKGAVALCAAVMLLTATAAPALAAPTFVVGCVEGDGDRWVEETDNENRAERLVRKCLRRGGFVIVDSGLS